MDVKADDKCANCFRDFADHEYEKDSINEYRCPVPHQESSYGYFHGGDPRKFHPDHEDCSEQEIASHKAACALWDEAEARGETPTPEKCPSGWIRNDKGEAIAHVLRSPYGIGCYTFEFDQYWEPLGDREPASDDELII